MKPLIARLRYRRDPVVAHQLELGKNTPRIDAQAGPCVPTLTSIVLLPPHAPTTKVLMSGLWAG